MVSLDIISIAIGGVIVAVLLTQGESLFSCIATILKAFGNFVFIVVCAILQVIKIVLGGIWEILLKIFGSGTQNTNSSTNDHNNQNGNVNT